MRFVVRIGTILGSVVARCFLLDPDLIPSMGHDFGDEECTGDMVIDRTVHRRFSQRVVAGRTRYAAHLRQSMPVRSSTSGLISYKPALLFRPVGRPGHAAP